MTSYIMKTLIGNEIDKVVKEFGGGEKSEQSEGGGFFDEDPIAEQNRQAAAEKERKARYMKVEKEREDARQKIRDKYNIKKKDEPSSSPKTQQHGKITEVTSRVNSAHPRLEKTSEPESEGFNPVKMTTNAFTSLKQKFGWT